MVVVAVGAIVAVVLVIAIVAVAAAAAAGSRSSCSRRKGSGRNMNQSTRMMINASASSMVHGLGFYPKPIIIPPKIQKDAVAWTPASPLAHSQRRWLNQLSKAS